MYVWRDYVCMYDVDATATKANRMLGLLMRSMQVSADSHRTRFDYVAALAAY